LERLVGLVVVALELHMEPQMELLVVLILAAVAAALAEEAE
jgi:hypothetical protein